ncbi:MAG: hypothetical protein ACK559_34025, partial [bacterium]
MIFGTRSRGPHLHPHLHLRPRPCPHLHPHLHPRPRPHLRRACHRLPLRRACHRPPNLLPSCEMPRWTWPRKQPV